MEAQAKECSFPNCKCVMQLEVIQDETEFKCPMGDPVPSTIRLHNLKANAFKVQGTVTVQHTISIDEMVGHITSAPPQIQSILLDAIAERMNDYVTFLKSQPDKVITVTPRSLKFINTVTDYLNKIDMQRRVYHNDS